jgi:hypothetical protein
MRRIRFCHNTGEPLLRQTPGSSGIWNDCQFVPEDDGGECDWVVVFEGMDEGVHTHCPQDNTIFITGEPSSIRSYNPAFLNQFGLIVTTQPEIMGKRVRHQQVAINWRIGLDNGTRAALMSFDDLAAMRDVPKPRLLSVICSSKRLTPGHELRLDFVDRLVKHFGSDIDLFGTEFNYIADKGDAIVPYKYHIAIENSVYLHYWTEKLADAFLGFAYPIYYGCPNVSDYFPEGSLTAIDITQPEAALRTIEATMADGTCEKSFDKIVEARKLVLYQYNLFAVIAELTSHAASGLRKKLVEIKPEAEFKECESMRLRTRRIVKRALGLFLRKFRKVSDSNQ